MNEERGKPRMPHDCSPHHSAPRTPGPRPAQIRGAKRQPFYPQNEIEAELGEEEDIE
jgi:hypothetical protein